MNPARPPLRYTEGWRCRGLSAVEKGRDVGRFTGLLLVATLSLAPSLARAQSALPAPPSLGPALILGIFGEVAAPSSFALRDQSDESPLHAAAFRVSLVMPLPAAPQARSTVAPSQPVAFVETSHAPSVSDQSSVAAARIVPNAAAALRVTAEYQPESILPSATTSTFSFPIRQSDADLGFATQNAGFGEFGALAADGAQVPLRMRVGGVHLEARFGAASQVSAADTESDEVLPAFIAPYTSVNRNALGAALAVPVSPRLLLGFGYDTEHLLAGYQIPGYDSLDARNDMYSGRLTFLIPRFSSALSLSAEQYRYQDNLLQSDAYTQLRESLNLTVKF
jgi:hypothetical protein